MKKKHKNRKRATLVLNAAYQVINVVPLRRLAKYLAKDKVDIIESSVSETFHLHGERIPLPTIVRLKEYGRFNTNKNMKYAKKKIFSRDKNTCCYCGKIIKDKGDFTIDHVIPQSQNGPSSWENCVTSCKKCNTFKANRTPEQANLFMVYQPFKPKSYTDMLLFDCNIQEEWKPYINNIHK